MKSSIENAYRPKAFRDYGHALIDLLADHLENAVNLPEQKAIRWTEPEANLKYWERDFADAEGGDPIAFFKTIIEGSVQLHNPKFMGHQISPPVPIAALGGLLSDFLNNGMGVYEMGVQSSALERLVIKIFAEAMGLDATTDGVLTSGGTLGNLTAMLAARSVKGKRPVWSEGDHGQFALMVSDQAHYCVDRAARIMGWGSAGIIKVPVNDRYQMRTELLPELFAEAKANDIEVVAVVGSACSTSTGSFDNLEAIGAFCAKNDLWFHVDGAHGGAFAISSQFRSLVKGIELADSVVMDFHKTLAIPAITTGLFFKNGALSFRTFSQKADYLFKSADEEWFNLAKRTFECTKLMMSVKIYAAVRTHGVTFFDDYVNQLVNLGKLMANTIRRRVSFELALTPECNIVCFRFIPEAYATQKELLNRINDRIRTMLLEDGTYYIVKTVLNEVVWLRSTLTNPSTQEDHFEALLDRIETIGKRLISAQKIG